MDPGALGDGSRVSQARGRPGGRTLAVPWRPVTHRLRVAAAACADDRLRLALEEAGEAEQTAAIEEALRERR